MTGRPANPALLGYVEFFLPTGRVVWLSKLRQWRTYRGLRCGYAHHVVNDRCMVEARERALEHFCDTNPTSVLETEIAAYDYPPQGGDSFEDALRNAISIGGDSDTIGAIAGGAAEALFGIPDDIAERGWRYLPQEMREVLTKLYMSVGKRL